MCKTTRVRSGIRTWGFTYRRLIDVNDFINEIQTGQSLVRARDGLSPVKSAGEGGMQGFIHQGTLARTGYTGNADETAERKVYIHRLQIVC